MELTTPQLAVLAYIAVSMVSLLLHSLRGDTGAVLRGGALLCAVSALLGGSDGFGMALVWWVAVVLVSSVYNAWR